MMNDVVQGRTWIPEVPGSRFASSGMTN